MSDERIKGPLLAFIKSVQPQLDYQALYPAKVFAQNADLTLELKPDDDRLPSMSKVPVRWGLPGCTAKVLPGARVLVGFEGTPPRAVALLWETASITELLLGDGAVQKAIHGDVFLTALNALINQLGVTLAGAGAALTTAGNDPTFQGVASAAALSILGAGTAMTSFAAALATYTTAAAVPNGFKSEFVKVK